MKPRFAVHLMFPELVDMPRAYDWSVVEHLPLGVDAPERILGVVSWLTRKQAEALADALNDICGRDWSERHPDWLAEARDIDAKYKVANPWPGGRVQPS